MARLLQRLSVVSAVALVGCSGDAEPRPEPAALEERAAATAESAGEELGRALLAGPAADGLTVRIAQLKNGTRSALDVTAAKNGLYAGLRAAGVTFAAETTRLEPVRDRDYSDGGMTADEMESGPDRGAASVIVVGEFTERRARDGAERIYTLQLRATDTETGLSVPDGSVRRQWTVGSP